MAKYSEAQKRAVAKYKAAKYKRVPLDVPIDFYEKIRTAAEGAEMSVNGYIKQSIDEKIARDQKNDFRKAEEIAPDAWDLKMIEEAKQGNDGSWVTFEELLQADGLTGEDRGPEPG